MEVHPSYFSVSQSSRVYVCTTGIGRAEKELFKLPSSVVLQDVMDRRTNFLATYKFLGTPKYLVALKYGITILHVGALYDLTNHYKEYEMKPFEGALFTTSGVREAMYVNYFTLHRAMYQPHASIFLDFMVASGKESEKYKFCQKYGVPTVDMHTVFEPEFYYQYLRRARTDVKDLEPGEMFTDKMFVLDKELPKDLFNSLKRLIIFNGGLRIPEPDCDPHFIFTMNFKKYAKYSNRLYHYQYVFDCMETNTLLYPEFYKVHYVLPPAVLEDCVCTLDTALGPDYNVYSQKLGSLGPIQLISVDMRTTHFISRGKPMPEKAPASGCGRVNYVTVEPEWIDQCLGKMERVSEARFIRNEGTFSLRKRRCVKRPWEDMLIQLTGFSPDETSRTIEKLKQFSIRYSESHEYEGCTHLVMKQMVQSEKFFSALSNGRWILRPEFLDDFENQEEFDFSKYEWREEDWMSEKEKKMSRAVKLWRERIGGGGSRPFHNWIVKVHCPQNRLSAYMRIIGHGGGRLTHWGNYTHLFVDRGYKEPVREANAQSADAIFSYLIN